MRELRGVSWPKYGRMESLTPDGEGGSLECYADTQLSCLEELKIKAENRCLPGRKKNMRIALNDEDDEYQDENLNGAGTSVPTAGKAKRILTRHKRQPKKKAGKDPFRERPSLTQLQQAKSSHTTATATTSAMMYEQFEDDEPLLDWARLTYRKAMLERRGFLKVG